ncbi:MAG: DUF4430 domain-containing protein [Oscillospiraceae bacterium]|nr:DUF4430 domain-containing protein [Oscillospiraceae bacterium]
MEAKKTNTKVIIIVVAVFVVLAAALGTVWFLFREKPVEGIKNITVSVIMADGSKTDYKIKTEEEYLQGAIEGDGQITLGYNSWGMVGTVNGIEEDTSKEEWWSLYADGEFAMVGIGELVVKDGGKYELRFTIGYDF